MPLGSVANRMGRVIGDNITGYSQDTYSGVVGTSMLKALDLNVGKTGLTETEALRMGYDAVSMIVPGSDKSHFYPGGKAMLIKLVADRADQRLLGVQVIGPGDMPRVIDTAAAALSARMTLQQLANMDVGYAPPYASAISPLAHGANALRNKINGLMDSVGPLAFRAVMDSDADAVFLDVRKDKEAETMRLDDNRYLLIPMHEFPARLKEVPAGKEIVALCQMGGRSYEVALMLKAAGIEKVSYLEGGMSAWTRMFGGNGSDE